MTGFQWRHLRARCAEGGAEWDIGRQPSRAVKPPVSGRCRSHHGVRMEPTVPLDNALVQWIGIVESRVTVLCGCDGLETDDDPPPRPVWVEVARPGSRWNHDGLMLDTRVRRPSIRLLKIDSE